MASLKPALLAAILRDTPAVAERCVGLREALPFANVSRMVASQPSILCRWPSRLFARVCATSEQHQYDEDRWVSKMHAVYNSHAS